MECKRVGLSYEHNKAEGFVDGGIITGMQLCKQVGLSKNSKLSIAWILENLSFNLEDVVPAPPGHIPWQCLVQEAEAGNFGPHLDL